MFEIINLIRYIRALQRMKSRSIENEIELELKLILLDELLKMNDEDILHLDSGVRARARTHTH